MKRHTEARLEDAIIDHLTTQGGYVFVDYREGEAKDRYDKARALDPALVLGFIQATQEKMWKGLEAIHGTKLFASQITREPPREILAKINSTPPLPDSVPPAPPPTTAGRMAR